MVGAHPWASRASSYTSLAEQLFRRQTIFITFHSATVNGSGISRDMRYFPLRLRNTSHDYKYRQQGQSVNEVFRIFFPSGIAEPVFLGRSARGNRPLLKAEVDVRKEAGIGQARPPLRGRKPTTDRGTRWHSIITIRRAAIADLQGR